ncbi:lipopolysaccharide assembly LapA domain-containing protein [Fictibacillus aquaticus]|uniref:Lipopolysaccharide assembly protein A domain-containing protein n=1 Tax=Fictibacillus aquaticus TaxID=2021314 RepID=A0A235F8A7_9BACL|nr:lipopolysaccharide assembly protein LapA domain-containing protein [Fictibacillus aquaticus]OYD57294.1 hypothetical protein CGZ90_11440 [Fictibacillus aquaticus]
MKAQGYLILGLVFALIIAVFAVVNGNDVEFNYIFGSVKWPLVLIILGSAAIGGLAAGFFGFIKMLQLNSTIKKLKLELQNSQKPHEEKTKEEAEPHVQI